MNRIHDPIDRIADFIGKWFAFAIVATAAVVLALCAFGCSVGNVEETRLYENGNVYKRKVWAGTLATDRAASDIRLVMPHEGGIEIGAGTSESKQDAAGFVEAVGGAAGATIGELIDSAVTP